MNALNETHDLARTSWVASANAPGCDFPIQNLPFGAFRPRGDGAEPMIGVAIGDQILDVTAVAPFVDTAARDAAAACASPHLNDLMALGPAAWTALRRALSRLLSDPGARERVERFLTPMTQAELFVPARIGNYTDFFASIFHATNAGKLFRPDNPLNPNYKYVPVAYHSRASSVRASGTPVRRPLGQAKGPDDPAPVYRASRALDYELEFGFYIGTPSRLGEPVPIGEAGSHVFGFCLLNDWSARDIQAWESQPLGPFLGKSFLTSVSPWVVTAEALAPYRVKAYARPDGDPAPLPHLNDAGDQASGGLDVTFEVLLATEKMRAADAAPFRLSKSSFATIYWTVAQMVAHHTSNGCNLEIGDLMGSGTCSGPQDESRGCLLELTSRGRNPIALPNGETRAFLQDGDEVIFRAHCERPGRARIGFGECRGIVAPALG
ncbi:MAG TPA: fumarylacetoacetase [Xanthobacteraceae bacterium]|nr:fumarylacetoacetase [Xanthobacteraceae bacterium]